jgi:L-2-amino-thiazoline-4-carboxylic acid hydrolase-like protein
VASADEFKSIPKPADSPTDILAPVFADTNLSLLDMVKLQAQVLVPVLKAFRAELGAARANQIAGAALREWSQKLYSDIGARLPGSPRQKWEAINAAAIPRIGNAVDIEMLKQEPDAVEFNITGCRYADFFRQLGEPELGAVLLCDVDVDIEAVGGPEVKMTRTQTIMKGAKYCDFRYRLKAGGGAEK